MTAASVIVRHQHRGGKGGRPYLPAYDDNALVEGRSVYVSTARSADEGGRILKSGHHNGKIGARVTKGAWKGFPIFTLTLEERATCPRTCRQWRCCMGNNMPFADRWLPGPELEEALPVEVARLQVENPRGFVIRLHVLGDFYSVRYARLWAAMMAACPALHIFGFTARIDPADPITREVARIRRDFPERFWLRFSDAGMAVMSTEVVDLPEHASEGSIVCPQQLDRTLACATCGLCWSSKKNIAWLRH